MALLGVALGVLITIGTLVGEYVEEFKDHRVSQRTLATVITIFLIFSVPVTHGHGLRKYASYQFWQPLKGGYACVCVCVCVCVSLCVCVCVYISGVHICANTCHYIHPHTHTQGYLRVAAGVWVEHLRPGAVSVLLHALHGQVSECARVCVNACLVIS
jgi:hypothetical protein